MPVHSTAPAFYEMEFYTIYPSPLGNLLITAEKNDITGIWYENSKTIPRHALALDTLPVFLEVRKWLDDYFGGKPCDANTLPLKPKGTPFQMTVWSLLLDIPWGETSTYGELAKLAAKRLGKETMSAQAIGNAVGKNPISIVIPCHRCLGAGDTLTGYAGGLDRKCFLLGLEKIQYK